MELLQFAEGGDDVFFLAEFFSGFAEGCLAFQVFLEVVGAQFVVELQRVVVLFDDLLVGFPEFGSLFCRHVLNLVPLLLKLLEIVIDAVYLIWIVDVRLDFLDDFEFFLVVCLAFSFLLLGNLGAVFTDDGHLSLEFCLVVVLGRLVLFGCSSTIDERFVGFLNLLFVQTVEDALQAVEFLTRGFFACLGNLLQTCEYFCLALVGYGCRRDFCLRFFGYGSFGYDGFFGYGLCCSFSDCWFNYGLLSGVLNFCHRCSNFKRLKNSVYITKVESRGVCASAVFFQFCTIRRMV